MTLSRQVNLNYLYYVAIRSSVSLTPDTQHAPQPVFNPSQNPNGFVAGSPTQFVSFNAAGALTQPFQLYQFATQAQAPNPSDPTNAVNLAVYSLSTIGIITNFQPVTNPGTNANPGTSNTLSFTVFANEIPDITAPSPTSTTPNSQIPNIIQVQFLTMNSTGGSSRVIDFLGASASQPEYVQVDLRTAGNYSNNTGAYSNTLGVSCPDPDLQITSWSITVTPA